jgi:hypothetical protein
MQNCKGFVGGIVVVVVVVVENISGNSWGPAFRFDKDL